MSATREFLYLTDDVIVITADIDGCPCVEIPLTELFDFATYTIVDNYLQVLHGYVIEILEDTAWMDMQSFLQLLRVGYDVYHPIGTGEVLAMPKPSLQLLILQMLRHCNDHDTQFALPLLIDFLMSDSDLPRRRDPRDGARSVTASRNLTRANPGQVTRSVTAPNAEIDTRIGKTVHTGKIGTGNDVVNSCCQLSGFAKDDNGHLSPRTPPLPLMDSNGDILLPKTTDRNGKFVFHNLKPRDYSKIEPKLPNNPRDFSNYGTSTPNPNETTDIVVGIALRAGTRMGTYDDFVETPDNVSSLAKIAADGFAARSTDYLQNTEKRTFDGSETALKAPSVTIERLTFDTSQDTAVSTSCLGFVECQKSVVVTSATSAMIYMGIMPRHVNALVPCWADVRCLEAIEDSNRFLPSISMRFHPIDRGRLRSCAG
jgi:hypothetical protein